ncbi:hypothetical protein QWA68_002194 [Fusarium oxysporum]|nr:hypothetical protein QWA68_002194 [Fusarium oxysporum]
MPEQQSELERIRRLRLHLEIPRMAESSQDGNLNVQRSDERRRELFRQSLDDAVAESRSEIGDSTTATLGSVGNMGERDDFLSVAKEKEKEDKAARDKELKALEVKIKALEEKWLTNSEEMQALKNKYDELNSKVDALERELRGQSIYVVRI